MKKGKLLAFIFTFVVTSLFVGFCANSTVENSWKCLTTGMGKVPMYMVSAASDGTVWGFGREVCEYYTSVGSLEKGHEETNSFDMNWDIRSFVIDDFYAVSSNCALISGYKSDGGKLNGSYQLAMVDRKGHNTKRIIDEDCSGENVTERAGSVKAGQFTYNDESVTFALWKNDQTCIYRILLDGDKIEGTQMISSFYCEPWVDSVVLPDGSVFMSHGTGILDCYSGQGIYQYSLEVPGAATELRYAGGAFYYKEVSGSTMNRIELTDGTFRMKEQISVEDSWIIASHPSGGLIWSDDGKITYSYEGNNKDANSVLYLSRGEAVMVLLLIFIGILIFSGAVIFIIYRRQHISIFLRGIVVVVVLTLLVFSFVAYSIPRIMDSSLEEKQQELVDLVSNFGGLIMQSEGGVESVLKESGQAMEHDETGESKSILTLYRYVENGFQLVSSTDPSACPGVIIQNDSMLLKAKENGVVHSVRGNINGKCFVSVTTNGRFLTKAEVSMLQSVANKDDAIKMFVVIMTIAILVVLVPMGFLFLYRVRINKLNRDVINVTTGDYASPVVTPYGDELGTLSRNIDIVRQLLKESEDKRLSIEREYMRFIPEQIIELLGIGSLENLTRETVANRKMVIMSVVFHVPGDELTTEQLFSTINTVIQRTTFPTVAYGGCSFNFNDKGYTVVFSGDKVSDALRAALAVKEAMDALNKEWIQEGRKTAQIRIALDIGMVQLGMVGDELYMVPTAVSHCMEKNTKMLLIGGSLDASILITEAMHGIGDMSGCRFVGKFTYGTETENLYELYEGDTDGLSKRKEDTKAEFDEAIQAFYQGDYSAAKRGFFHLARTGSSRDGALRYYLNLADRYEQSPPDHFLL